MAGHSKWAQIKRTKAVKDAKKGAFFAQCSREIMMAARLGGGDPDSNFRLRTAIVRAKALGIPNDNIRRAIEKGVGAGGADHLESLSYEGYGPGGVAILIEAMTDNRNRTAGDIRSYFNKYQGNLGADGCVAWIFEEKGVIGLAAGTLPEDRMFETVIEAGATDFEADSEPDSRTTPGEAAYRIYTAPEALNTVAQTLSAQGLAVISATVTRTPRNTVHVGDEQVAAPLLRLLDALESHDDVQNVYANFDMDDAALDRFTSS